MPQRHTRSHLASWRATCVIDGELGPAHWRECRVIEITPDGMGFTLCHEEPADLVGGTVHVQFPAGSGSLRVSLEGSVKSAVAVGRGITRVRLEFRGLSQSERALATVLDVLTQTCEPVDPGRPEDIPSRSVSAPRWTSERMAPKLEVLAGA
jgi:hypothetical protein